MDKPFIDQGQKIQSVPYSAQHFPGPSRDNHPCVTVAISTETPFINKNTMYTPTLLDTSSQVTMI